MAWVSFKSPQIISTMNSSYDCSFLALVHCQGIIPPTITPSSTNSSFNGSSDKRMLYALAGYSSAYQSSSWADFFGTITEMD